MICLIQIGLTNEVTEMGLSFSSFIILFYQYNNHCYDDDYSRSQLYSDRRTNRL